MKFRRNDLARGLRTTWFVCALVVSLTALGQDDPFGDSAPKPSTDHEAPPKKAPQESEPKADHPVVQALRQVSPKTPLQQMRAARAVAQVEAYVEARKYLRQILQAGLDDAAYVELVDRFGSAFFLELRTNEKLQPEGGQLAEAALAAVRKRWTDPAQVGQLLEQAARARGNRRLARVAELRAGGDLPAVVLTQWLADDARRADAVALIRTWNPTAEEPLGRALQAFWALRLDGVEVLPETRIGQVTPLLLSTAAVSSDSAQGILARQVLERLLGRTPPADEVRRHLWATIRSHLREARKVRREEPMARVTVWAWKTDLSQVEPRKVWKDEWETLQAGRAAVALAKVDPDNVLARQLLHLMEFQLHYGGEDPEHGIAISSIEIPEGDAALQKAEDLHTMLELALGEELSGAAVHICDKIVLVQRDELLRSVHGGPSLLVRTMLHPDRNIRFAATRAVASLAQGNGPFAGAGTLIDSLQFFMTSHGESRLLIGATRSDVAAEYAATARILGFTAQFAGSGRELVQKLYHDADFSAVMIDASISDPPLRETVQQIRKSPRGADAVILVMARGENFAQLQEAFRLEPRTVVRIAVPEPESLAEDMRHLLAQAGRWRTLPAERLQQAKEAMTLSLALLEDPVSSKYIDGSRFEAAAAGSLYSEELGVAAAQLLTRIGTDTAQRALIEFSLRRGELERTRKAALIAASEHLKRYGLLLTRKQLDTIFEATREHRDDKIAAVMIELLRATLTGQSRASRAGTATEEPQPEAG